MVCGRIFEQVHGEVSGSVSVETGGEISYLKKRISFIPRGSQRGGVVVRPNRSYIPKLVEMFKLETRRTKQVPHNSGRVGQKTKRNLEKSHYSGVD